MGQNISTRKFPIGQTYIRKPLIFSYLSLLVFYIVILYHSYLFQRLFIFFDKIKDILG